MLKLLLRYSHYDIVVSGGGPVGSSLIATLSSSVLFPQSSKKLALIDIGNWERIIKFEEIPDQRVVSINQGSWRFFQSGEIVSNIMLQRIGKNKRMVIGDKLQNIVQFSDQKCISRIIQNNNLIHALFKKIQKEQKTDLYLENKIIQIQYLSSEKLLSLTLNSQQQIFTKQPFIIGYSQSVMAATHKSKILSKFLHMDGGTIKWQLFALFKQKAKAKLHTKDFTKMVSWQFCLYGRITHLQCEVDDTRLKIFYSENKLANQQFNLIDCLDPRFKILGIKNQKKVFPLYSLQAKKYIHDRVALIGDSAHSVHPMTGLGLNLGITDTIILANNILKNKKAGNDIGQQLCLRNYQVDSKLINVSTTMTNQIIKNCYQNNRLGSLRKLGMLFLNNSECLKRLMMKIANNHVMFPTKFQWVQE